MPLIFALLALPVQTPCTPAMPSSNPSVLIVEVVDPGWLPLPRMEVRVKAKGASGKTERAFTDVDGVAAFSVPRGIEYDVEVVQAPGFKKGEQKGVFISTNRLAEPQPAARVQVRVKLSGPKVHVY
jgi:hypothetical protein